MTRSTLPSKVDWASSFEEEKTNAIRRFKTMTTMISVLNRQRNQQQHPTIFSTRNDESLKRDAIQVEALDALAILLQRDSEPVAVSTFRPTVQSDGTYAYEVVVCSQSCEVAQSGKRISISSKRNQLNLADPLEYVSRKGWVFIFTSSKSHALTLRLWMKLSSSMTFIDHARALCMICNQHKASNGRQETFEILKMYIIATCAPSMLRGISDNEVSKPFIESLLNVPRPSHVEGPFPLQRKRDQFQVIGDLYFADTLPGIATAMAQRGKGDITNLNQRAQVLKKRPCDLALLYTFETCDEFHILLCFVLDGYVLSLQNYLSAMARNATDPERLPGMREWCVEIRQFGLFLRNLARSSALLQHLNRMAPYLEEYLTAHHGTNALSDALNDECRHDQGTSRSKYAAVTNLYIRWFHAFLGHLNSIFILHALVIRLNEREAFTLGDQDLSKRTIGKGTFSLTILAVDHPDQTMKPWHDVINDLYSPRSLKYSHSLLTADTVITMIDTLFDRGSLGQDWAPRSALATGQGFTGTLHCSAYLASMLYAPYHPTHFAVSPIYIYLVFHHEAGSWAMGSWAQQVKLIV